MLPQAPTLEATFQALTRGGPGQTLSIALPGHPEGGVGVQQAGRLSPGLRRTFSDQGLTGLSPGDGFDGETRCWQQKTRVSVLALGAVPAPSGDQVAQEPQPWR